MSPAELKNCPFCGGDASAEPHLQHKPGCYFDVLAQFKAAPIGDLALADEVLAAWNRRAQPAEEVQQDTALLNFIEGNPQLSLRFHKKRWALVGMTNYEYDVFKTAREAIVAAMAKDTP